jgi:hypothetical protein
MMDDKALEEKAFEFCEKSGCLHGASLTTLLREVAKEARREAEEMLREEHDARMEALAQRDEARATKDMHKERQEEAWAEVERLSQEGCAISDHHHAMSKLSLITEIEIRANKAEAEIERVRGALRDLLRGVDARLSLDSGFKGMGHNIAVESAGRLRVDAEYARRVLEREK